MKVWDDGEVGPPAEGWGSDLQQTGVSLKGHMDCTRPYLYHNIISDFKWNIIKYDIYENILIF